MIRNQFLHVSFWGSLHREPGSGNRLYESCKFHVATNPLCHTLLSFAAIAEVEPSKETVLGLIMSALNDDGTLRDLISTSSSKGEILGVLKWTGVISEPH